MTRAARRLLPVVLAAALGPTFGVAVQAQAQPVAPLGDCSETNDSVVAQRSGRPSAPLAALRIKEAQAAVGRAPGAGVGVAVVDQGIVSRPDLPVVASYSVHGPSVHTVDYHGTAIAGLIAGGPRLGGALTGIAPAAQLVDVQVGGWPSADGTPTSPNSAYLVQGLEWVAHNAGRYHIRIANVSTAVARSAQLDRAVSDVRKAGVLLVASSGNRPEEGSSSYYSQFATPANGQDAASVIYPAGYPQTVAAATLAGDPATLLPNSAIDVAVPTQGAVSLALNGGDCVLSLPATSWASAEVSGVLALLASKYPDDGPAQLTARLVDTASGTTPSLVEQGPTGGSLYVGAGIVQPVEALTRPLHPTAAGDAAQLTPEPDRTPPATAPVARVDQLDHTRHLAVWAGIVGGAALVLTALMRPMFVRRRP